MSWGFHPWPVDEATSGIAYVGGYGQDDGMNGETGAAITSDVSTFDFSAQAKDKIVVYIWVGDENVDDTDAIVVTDSVGNSYKKVTGSSDAEATFAASGATGSCHCLFQCDVVNAITGGATTLTITLDDSALYLRYIVRCYRDRAGGHLVISDLAVDTDKQTTGAGDPWVGGTVNVLEGDVMVGCCQSIPGGTTHSLGTGMGNLETTTTDGQAAGADKTIVTPGTDAPTMNVSGSDQSYGIVYVVSLAPAVVGPVIKVLDLASPTSTGLQAIYGIGFTPVALLFFSGTDSGSDDTFQSDAMIGIGVATAPSEECAYAACSRSGLGTSDATNRSQADRCVLLEYPTVSPVIAAELAAFHGDGFTLNWPTVHAAARTVTVVAFGGSAITDAYAGQITVPTSGATVATTAPGFQPTGIIFVHADAVASGAQASHFQFGVGFADADLNQCVLKGTALDAAANGDAVRTFRTDSVYINQDQAGTEDGRASLASMDGTGFTLSISNNPGGAAPVGYLAFAGPPVRVGAETQATSVTTKKTSLDIDPAGVLFTGPVATAGSTPLADMFMFFGASDGTDDRSNFSADDDGPTTTDSNRRHSTTKSIVHGNLADSVDAQADISALAGGFTLDWTTADATAREFGYFAIGTLAPALPWPRRHQVIGYAANQTAAVI